MQDRIGGLQHVPVEGKYAGMADYPVVRFIIMKERPFIKPGSLKSPQNGFSQTFLGNGKCHGWCGFGGYTIEEAILELLNEVLV